MLLYSENSNLSASTKIEMLWGGGGSGRGLEPMSVINDMSGMILLAKTIRGSAGWELPRSNI
jgi:hypothetical protein